jgi:hypothetical protein
MARSTPSLQYEYGKQSPLRPVTAIFDIASNFGLPEDPSPDWTAAGHRLTPRLVSLQDPTGDSDTRDRWLDDEEIRGPQIAVSGTDITLKPGIWKFEIHAFLTNDGGTGGNEKAVFAVTNSDGTTVHYEGARLEVQQNCENCYVMTCFAHLATEQVVNIRACQDDLGTPPGLFVVAGDIMTVTKIGNENEN